MSILNIFKSEKPKFSSCTDAVKHHFKRHGKLTSAECYEKFHNLNLHKIVEALELNHGMKFERPKKKITTEWGAVVNITIYTLVK